LGSGDAQAASKAADTANNATVAARRRRGCVTACIFSDVPYSLNERRRHLTARGAKHSLDNTNNTVNPDPLCAGIVYHGINRLWPEPGNIVAPVPWRPAGSLDGLGLRPGDMDANMVGTLCTKSGWQYAFSLWRCHRDEDQCLLESSPLISR
jgi:hypothetical protein